MIISRNNISVFQIHLFNFIIVFIIYNSESIKWIFKAQLFNINPWFCRICCVKLPVSDHLDCWRCRYLMILILTSYYHWSMYSLWESGQICCSWSDQPHFVWVIGFLFPVQQRWFGLKENNHDWGNKSLTESKWKNVVYRGSKNDTLCYYILSSKKEKQLFTNCLKSKVARY